MKLLKKDIYSHMFLIRGNLLEKEEKIATYVQHLKVVRLKPFLALFPVLSQVLVSC